MIREAELKDYHAIYEMGEKLHENYSKKYDLVKLTEQEYFHVLVYEKEKKIIGFLTYSSVLDSTDVLDIFVLPTHRQEKVATSLLDYMITNANPKTTFLLEVAVDNLPAINLYQKFGFKVIHTRKKYYGKKDAYVMEREAVNE